MSSKLGRAVDQLLIAIGQFTLGNYLGEPDVALFARGLITPNNTLVAYVNAAGQLVNVAGQPISGGIVTFANAAARLAAAPSYVGQACLQLDNLRWYYGGTTNIGDFRDNFRVGSVVFALGFQTDNQYSFPNGSALSEGSGGLKNFTLPPAGGELIGKVAAPASAGASGVAGMWAQDASFIYVCTATNTWKRAALSTW